MATHQAERDAPPQPRTCSPCGALTFAYFPYGRVGHTHGSPLTLLLFSPRLAAPRPAPCS